MASMQKMPQCKIHVKAFGNTCDATLQNHILPRSDFNIVAESEQKDISFEKNKTRPQSLRAPPRSVQWDALQHCKTTYYPDQISTL